MGYLRYRPVSASSCFVILTTLVLMQTIALGGTHEEPPSRQELQGSVNYSIIVTGSELLTGVYADGHTVFITNALRPLGLHCVGSVSVDDQEIDIRHALDFTLPRSQLVIVTGGLGPTETDITRDVLSAYTGIALREHPDVLRKMEQHFHTPRNRIRANLRRQTRVPVRGTYLTNASGTAVGLVFDHQDKVIVALPGPPRELQPMVKTELTPILAKKFGVRRPGCSLTVRFVGIGQSQIDQVLKEQIALPSDIMQTSQFEAGRVDFTFSLADDTPAGKQRLEQLRQNLLKHLGEHIYACDGETTLEAVVTKLLAAKDQQVVLVELGSGGIGAAGFARASVGREVFAGGFVGAEMEQIRSMLEIGPDHWPETNREARLVSLARSAQQRTGSDWAVVVGPPESKGLGADPRLRVLIRTPRGKETWYTWPWRGRSSTAQARLETQLFDLMRRAAAKPE